MTRLRGEDTANAGRPAIALAALRLFAGACFGLRRKTALVTLTCRAPIELAAFDQRISQLLRTVLPTADEWGGRTLPSVGELKALGHRFCELLLLVLGWSREPIFEARLLGASADQLLIAVEWEREATLRSTLPVVLRLAQAGCGDTVVGLERELAEIKGERPGRPPPLVARLTTAAHRRGHPIEVHGDFVQIGWGARAKRLSHALTQSTSAIAVRTARWKCQTNRLLAHAGLPVPKCALANTFETAQNAAMRIGWPVVVKPSDMDGGTAVATGIREEGLLRRAFDEAKTKGGGSVLVEQHVDGDDHRLLVVGDRVLVATKRTPGGVIGDGHSTVADLIELANADPRRGGDKQVNLLVRLALDEEALRCLSHRGLAADSVPASGQVVPLRSIANISMGGTAEDITDRVHPDNRKLAIRAARIVGLDIAGIDLLIPDIERSWRETGAAICEVNAQPGLRVHWLANTERDHEGEIIDWLPGARSTRIPVGAIAGLPAAGEVALALHAIMSRAGRSPGTCTVHGAWVADDCINDRDCAGFSGARMVLGDPFVDTAIIELPAASIARSGHLCDRYDVAAIVSPAGAREGFGGATWDLFSRVRSTIVTRADDPLYEALRHRGDKRRMILVAAAQASERLNQHRTSGGECVFAARRGDQAWIMLAKGARTLPILPFADISFPLQSVHLEDEAVLFAAAMAWALGVVPQRLGDLLSGTTATLPGTTSANAP